MSKTFNSNFLKLAALALLAAGASCVQSRASRNGVFNENQYVRKSFLIAPGDGSQTDPGWNLRATVMSVTTPNPIGGLGIFPGAATEAGLGGAPNLIRFAITQDKVQMLNMREITSDPSDEDTPEVVNAWGITNVDLKYRINLDGETTNFFEENQELDWQQRQWIKVQWDKNDMSDIAPLGSFAADMLSACTDVGNSSVTLVPNSFVVDEKHNYMEWQVQITVPIKFDDTACITAYGAQANEFLKLGRQNSTFVLKYSLQRAVPTDQITYTPLVVAEKDPIRRKYGVFDFATLDRDPNSGLLSSRQLAMRFDPKKPIKWYFTHEVPDYIKQMYTGPNGVAAQTNAILKDAGVDVSDPNTTGGVSFSDFDAPDTGLKCAADTDCAANSQCQNGLCTIQRQMGDVRYSMISWLQDMDNGGGFLGITSFNTDVRTGETLSGQVVISNAPLRDTIVERLDAYLQTIGQSEGVDSTDPWSDLGPCMNGQTVPLNTDDVTTVHDADSVYAKMQTYLQKPQAEYGNLGPSDFIATQDADFDSAYFTLVPYLVYADPAMNQFVVPEGGSGVYGPTSSQFLDMLRKEYAFQQMAGQIDQGIAPYDALGPNGLTQATAFLNQWKQSTLDHQNYTYQSAWAFGRLGHRADLPTYISLMNVMSTIPRTCVNGAWETKEQWITRIEQNFNAYTAWHEFGHSIGLEHNFMASVDKPNFPVYTDAAGSQHYSMFSSSVMEYGTRAAEILDQAGWGPYDQGAIGWIYANNAPDLSKPAGTGLSGQTSPTSPWKDPRGFRADGSEISFLRCHHEHLMYTPLCREFDVGSTPSEIIANQIDDYEWKYKWNNFRLYRKFWDNSAYANVPAALFVDMRKFMSLWLFDWGSAELADTFRRIGITNPNTNGSQLEYYTQLTNKFTKEASMANQMVAAFHKAIIQESSGERPYATVYDKFYGDVTEQGIILDKLFAMQGFVALWPSNNYDVNQAGNYIASYEGFGEPSYDYVAQDAVTSMIGGQYDVYPYFVPLAVAQFAQDTHSPAFAGNSAVRDWIGGHVWKPPLSLDGFLAYFRNIAVQNNFPGCPNLETCQYDPRPLSDTHNQFLGPDSRTWIWVYILDRDEFVAVEKDRNIATYVIMYNYTDDVIAQQDDGAYPGGAYGNLLPIKYFLDSFDLYN